MHRRFLMVRYGHRAATYGPPLQLIMTFYAVPTTNDDIDHTCTELLRRAAYTDRPALAHDAINMFRSLQTELERANVASTSAGLTWQCEICRRVHNKPLSPGAVCHGIASPISQATHQHHARWPPNVVKTPGQPPSGHADHALRRRNAATDMPIFIATY